MNELEEVLSRAKFSRYADERTRREFVERIHRHATIVADPVDQPAVTRDTKDDYLVALGRCEGVEAIISGAGDLLDARLQQPPVWTPRQLADHLAR